jgi:allantoinase
VSFVINFEEGAEMSLSAGDAFNEKVYEVTDEISGVADLCMESHFEYGTKVAWWRIADTLERLGVSTTISTCGKAADLLPRLALGAACAHGRSRRAASHRPHGRGADEDRRQATGRMAHALDTVTQHAAPAR